MSVCEVFVDIIHNVRSGLGEGAEPACFVTTMDVMFRTAMMAFTGRRLEPDNWAKYKACLPEGWTKIRIDRIYLGGEAV